MNNEYIGDSGGVRGIVGGKFSHFLGHSGRKISFYFRAKIVQLTAVKISGEFVLPLIVFTWLCPMLAPYILGRIAVVRGGDPTPSSPQGPLIGEGSIFTYPFPMIKSKLMNLKKNLSGKT